MKAPNPLLLATPVYIELIFPSWSPGAPDQDR